MRIFNLEIERVCYLLGVDTGQNVCASLGLELFLNNTQRRAVSVLGEFLKQIYPKMCYISAISSV